MPEGDIAREQHVLASRLRREIAGEVHVDAFTRGRYSTDASIYQIEPVAVVLPRTEADVSAVLAVANELGVPVIPRGAGTSQSGQTIGRALVVDTSKFLDQVLEVDPEAGRAVVQPGVVLDRLNAQLRPTGLFFPVDPATASQATLGGMAGNNSSGSRSIRYGLMVDNVLAIDAALAGGEVLHFAGAASAGGPDAGSRQEAAADPSSRGAHLAAAVRAVAAREAEELARRVPRVLRHVAGYNLHRLLPDRDNLASLLVGSEGTLAFFTRIHLQLQPIPSHRVLGVCHFPDLRAALEATRHIVTLDPAAVELMDRALIGLARDVPQFQGTISRFVRGTPGALLLVEFAGSDAGRQIERLQRLGELMGDLGHPGALVEAVPAELQAAIWSVRKAGLNIATSMKGDAKPVSFIEDCAVPLEHLAEYAEALTDVFRRHGTEGIWYAHASVGCLHVRPLLDLKQEGGVRAMRAIAEEALALVQRFRGAFSGEHGDGLVRSEFIAPMLGERLVRAFEEVKDAFDPRGLLNPGKIVRAPKMDDRTLLRYGPGYAHGPLEPALDWTAWGGFARAAEMCNNNGACRKLQADVMCPSFRATRDEQHTTRGRANTLRLVLSGQLGASALTSEAMHETMSLCVGCKACRRECPAGVDMARMKIEFLHHYRRRHGLRLGDRLVAYLPRYAGAASRLAWLANARNRSTRLARLAERWLGLDAARELPSWRADAFRDSGTVGGGDQPREVVLLVDTFSRYFEPENVRAAVGVLAAAGCRVVVPPADRRRPLCCGRTFLSAGLVDEARREARRTVEGLAEYVQRGVPILGLEPSCLLTLRDEFLALLPGGVTTKLAEQALLLEEFLERELDADRLSLPLRALPTRRVRVHGHCHQKAFGALGPTLSVLRRIPDLSVEAIDSTCCGMAGSFGYEAAHADVSRRMAELDLLPAVRATDAQTWLVADGTSCRQQIRHGSGRTALHAVRVLRAALPAR